METKNKDSPVVYIASPFAGDPDRAGRVYMVSEFLAATQSGLRFCACRKVYVNRSKCGE